MSPGHDTGNPASEAAISPGDTNVLGSITGREDNRGAQPGSSSEADIKQPVDDATQMKPRPHQPGMGANETKDGLSGNEESARQAAEAEVEPAEIDAVPVFERGDLPPRV